MSEDLVKPIKLGAIKKIGLSARREEARKAAAEIKPDECANRLGLIFDDSGSMMGQPIQDAHKAVEGFTAACNPFDTSIAVYPMNEPCKPLTIDYSLINIFVNGINATGGTPLYTTMINMISDENITRAVIFSDGEPTDETSVHYETIVGSNGPLVEPKTESRKEKALKLYIDKEIPCDTVYIGSEVHVKHIALMKEIAERTGGVFIHFTDSSVFSKQLKYLAPKFRALLMNKELKEKVERGETI